MSIRARISVVYSTFIAIIIALAGLVFLHFYLKTMKRQLTKYVYDYANISLPIIIYTYEQHKNEVPLVIYREIFPVLDNNPYLQYIEIVSPDGKVLFNTNRARLGLLTPTYVPDTIMPFIKTLYPSIKIEGYTIHIFLPYIDEFGQHLYTVHFVNYIKDYIVNVQKTLFMILAIVLFTLIASIIISTYLARNITAKLEKLKNAALAFEKGDMEVNFYIKSKDEIGELSQVFESMRHTIKRTIKELEKSIEELKELDRLKTEFITNVSHELKTPLTAALGYISLLRKGKIGKISEDAFGALEIVSRNLQELNLKIDSILEISKLQSGTEYFSYKELDLSKLVKRCVERYKPVAGLKGLDLRTKIEPDIVIEGDEKSLENMLCNLVDNAVKFTHEGWVEVRLRMGKNKKYAVLEVEDTGIGIPEDKKHKIFDRFYQVEASTTRKYGGIGLGLSLVQKVIELHNGIIRVKSKPGKGTTFIVYLPIKQEKRRKT